MDLSSIKEFDLNNGGTTKFFGKDVVNIFYRVLSNANRWDIGLGFFSLSGFKELAWPLSKFILENKGTIRIYCNHSLSEKDYAILSKTKKLDFNKNPVYEDLNMLYKALVGSNDELFNECISYLVSNDLIQIKVLVKRQDNHGISHQKNSIFYDDKQNEVTLCGSGNESAAALRFNYEDVTASCSFWNEKSSNDTIKLTQQNFEENFLYGNEEWKILPISSEELKEKLIEIGFRSVDRSLLQKSSLKNYKKSIFSDEIEKEIEDEIFEYKKVNCIPHFPKSYTPYDYQVKAYENWVLADKKGLFAMATGTGKTVTSLYCFLREFEENYFS